MRTLKTDLVTSAGLAALAALQCVFATAATAQTTASDDQTNSDTQTASREITVTANRREQSVLDVPYNISVIGGDAITGSQTLDNAELLRSIPGATAIDQGPRNGGQFNSIRIRGLNVDDSNFGDYAVASVATVSTYVNETPVYANLALVDINRVEVLRGPQGTLYGSGALGGTIKYILQEPKLGRTEGSVAGLVTSTRGSGSIGYQATGIVNVPLGDAFALRLNVQRQDTPGITDYTNLYQLDGNGVPERTATIFTTGPNSARYTRKKDADDYDSWFARAALLFAPNDTFKATLSYIYQSDHSGGRRQPTDGLDGNGKPYGAYDNGALILEPSDREFHMGSLEASLDLGFATLTSATSYYDNRGGSQSDNTGFYANAFANFYYFYPRPLYTAQRTFGDKALTQEVRLVSSGSHRFDWVVGAYYQDQTRRSTQVSDLVGFKDYAAAFFGTDAFVSTDNVFTYRRRDKFRDAALFGELTFNITDRFRVMGGLRYFDNKSDVTTFVRTGAYNSFAGSVTTPFTSKDSDVLFKINGSYNFGDDELLYATMSEGYRRGGNNGVPTIGRFANDPAFLTYRADKVTNYEAGVKGRILNGIQYDVSLYYIDWRNPQFNTSTPIGSYFVVLNGVKARTRGLEAQLSGKLGSRFNYSLGYAYVDAEVRKSFSDPLGNVIAPPGTPLPGIPKHAITVAGDYTVPISDSLSGIFRFDGFYQSSTQNVLDQTISDSRKFSPFSIWDLTATLAGNDWSLSLFAKNVFDNRGVTGSFNAASFGPNPTAEFYGSDARTFITLPRTIGLSGRVSF
ncbi:outer membrane receptor protein involved in Fe transport [Novosphingobium chloroacetimidivorans]|uniref:Outer membrane receptor protein involved in Fe transport n=1 Tax=Novosphingobium chloroacetimidivorans TaxID=1428314 RepID=A0A7W7K9C0_9SPHN|nr:TonB-dependent receptor [Novosphingobium chloroacetimidivorans]MBB4858610.1 outer membrane receptor protein involved in Fe transport [Novosphingobium chloroacetimidivorans]